MMDVQSFVSKQKPLIEKCLDELLPLPRGSEKILYEAMRYSVFAGGKRLRPCLFIATMELLEQDSSQYLPFACALEMIHTYSLIHDDLPAMDDDDFRRGQPTCHKVFGEAQAILAGDALLTYAFNCMLKIPGQVDAANLLAAIDKVSDSAGINGMIVGQVVDIAWQGQSLTQEQVDFIHEKKTGALFSAAIVSAAILANATSKQIDILSSYAHKIGLIFQISDDILDVTGDQAKLGKPVGSDDKNRKTTYVSLFGLKEARRMGHQAAQEAREILIPFGKRAELLQQVPSYFIDRDS
ncbi:MAG: polyprenyl synthetase family protein [Bacillota bacterium]|jgi:geranylgeranyl diphosphate synthase type II